MQGVLGVTAHPDTPDGAPSDIELAWFTPLIRSLALPLPFVAVDLARRTDGTWRVVELGDGQDSDRPARTDASAFVGAVLTG